MDVNLGADQFEDSEREIFITRFRFACLYFGAPLILAFSPVDAIYAPDRWIDFLLIRLTAIPFALFGYYAYSIRTIAKHYHYFPAIVVTIYMGIYHAYLVSQTGFEQSKYYAGINLACYILLSFLPWPLKSLPYVMIATMGPYFIALFGAQHQIEKAAFLTSTAFMLSTAFLSLSSYVLNRKLRKSEFLLRVTGSPKIRQLPT